MLRPPGGLQGAPLPSCRTEDVVGWGAWRDGPPRAAAYVTCAGHLSIRFIVQAPAERQAEGGRRETPLRRSESAGCRGQREARLGAAACGVRLAADALKETGQDQGEPLPGAGRVGETGIKPPPIKVVSAAGPLRPLGAAGGPRACTGHAAEKVRGPEDKLPAFQGCPLLHPRGLHSHWPLLARGSPRGWRGCWSRCGQGLTAPWSGSHCPLPRGFGAQPGSALTPVLPTTFLATPPSSLGLRQTCLPGTRGPLLTARRCPGTAVSEFGVGGHSLSSERLLTRRGSDKAFP